MRYSAARAGLVDDVVRIWSGKPLLLANQRKTFPFVHIASSSKPNVPNAATTQANDERFDLNLQLFDVSDFHHAYIEQELPARRVLGNGDFAQAAVAPERPVVMKRLSRPKSAFARTFMAGGIGTDGLPMPSTAVTAETTTVETTTVVDNKSMTRQSLTGRPLSMISRLDEHRLEASHADADINTETCTVLIPPSLGGASLLMHASPPPDVPLPPTPSNVSELDAAGSA